VASQNGAQFVVGFALLRHGGHLHLEYAIGHGADDFTFRAAGDDFDV
jgi:hypothetical protein